MAQIEIVSEREAGSGWVFTAQVLDDAGTLRGHEVSLSWVDYNHWSGSGTDQPAAVAAAVLRFLLGNLPPEQVPPTFDAAVARRMFPGADAEIPAQIHDL